MKAQLINKKALVFIAILFLVIFASFGCESSYKDYITYENFSRIENGMTYDEVVEIFGGKQGELSTSAGGYGYNFEYYVWEDDWDNEIITICFENGVVTAKAQIGLY